MKKGMAIHRPLIVKVKSEGTARKVAEIGNLIINERKGISQKGCPFIFLDVLPRSRNQIPKNMLKSVLCRFLAITADRY
jgi:hypothetical protein